MKRPWESGLAMNTEVSKVVWPWREADSGESKDRAGKLRQAAVIQGVVGGLIGTGIYTYLSTTVGMVAWSIAGILTLIGLISPTGLYAKVKSGFDAFGRFVGQVMSWTLLVPVYWLFFTPFHWLFRRGKKDSMTRWLEPDASTYWIERDEEPKKESYERQF
ncbi:MAG TPA: hypothetical protein EYO33_16780 [Phycisphaerales bacterium]|nr:hypothetical protein [Phycisphaerales bacterium]